MGITSENKRSLIEEVNPENGTGLLLLDPLLKSPDSPSSLRTYARATLATGASVGYHEHFGESESYYILSGIGEYSDDGVLSKVQKGDVTFTPSGHGHAIKNIGTTPLVFMVLIILD